jgi:hypothetical protein
MPLGAPARNSDTSAASGGVKASRNELLIAEPIFQNPVSRGGETGNPGGTTLKS